MQDLKRALGLMGSLGCVFPEKNETVNSARFTHNPNDYAERPEKGRYFFAQFRRRKQSTDIHIFRSDFISRKTGARDFKHKKEERGVQ